MFAVHYGVAIIPARVRRPKDKAKAEGGVLIVECFYKNKRVVSHLRLLNKGRHTTVREHMTKSH